MRTKLSLALAFVVVTGVSFYLGAEFISRGNSFSGLFGAPGAHYTALSGQIVSVGPGSLTIRNGLGINTVVPLTQNTRLLRAPTPGLPSDLASGATVAIVMQDGATQQIQIVSPPAAKSTHQ